jgi:hypothetical protein
MSDLNGHKRPRRPAKDIPKNYKCRFDKACQKIYGTQLAMEHHIKFKHNGGTKGSRKKWLELKIRAWADGSKTPESSLTWPEGYCEKLDAELANGDKHKTSRGFGEIVKNCLGLYATMVGLV